jgi:hypothetical protein
MGNEHFSNIKLKSDFVNIVFGRVKRIFSGEEWETIAGHLETDRAVIVRFHSDSERSVMWAIYKAKGHKGRFSKQYVIGDNTDPPTEFGDFPIINKELGLVNES